MMAGQGGEQMLLSQHSSTATKSSFLFQGEHFTSSLNQPLSQAFEFGKSLSLDRLVVRACLRMAKCHRNTLL